jgi:hypothetical protein
MKASSSAVDLYWLPLGAGGKVVRACGRIYELLAATFERRALFDLYHSALQVELPTGRYVIEQTPVPDLSGEARGVVAEGPVGAAPAGRFRVFRYEVRVWPGGCIPDIAKAVESPQRLTEDERIARRVLDVVSRVPTLVWGRREPCAEEMWNSNSVIAWTLTQSGIDAEIIRPPAGGRAPGWRAGLAVAQREVAGQGLNQGKRE